MTSKLKDKKKLKYQRLLMKKEIVSLNCMMIIYQVISSGQKKS
jgi:hypothetical protein